MANEQSVDRPDERSIARRLQEIVDLALSTQDRIRRLREVYSKTESSLKAASTWIPARTFDLAAGIGLEWDADSDQGWTFWVWRSPERGAVTSAEQMTCIPWEDAELTNLIDAAALFPALLDAILKKVQRRHRSLQRAETVLREMEGL